MLSRSSISCVLHDSEETAVVIYGEGLSLSIKLRRKKALCHFPQFSRRAAPHDYPICAFRRSAHLSFASIVKYIFSSRLPMGSIMPCTQTGIVYSMRIVNWPQKLLLHALIYSRPAAPEALMTSVSHLDYGFLRRLLRALQDLAKKWTSLGRITFGSRPFGTTVLRKSIQTSQSPGFAYLSRK